MRAKGRRAERIREERAADLDRRAAMFWMLHETGASYGQGSPQAASGRSARTTRTISTAGPSTSRAGSPSWRVSVARARSWVLPSVTVDGFSNHVSSSKSA